MKDGLLLGCYGSWVGGVLFTGRCVGVCVNLYAMCMPIFCSIF